MSKFDGQVLRETDTGYEVARCAAVWNGLKPKRFPAVIVVAKSHKDVVSAVQLAKVEGLSIGIRSGGHSWVGNAVRDGGLLLDLSHLKSIAVDAATRTAVLDTGVVMSELHETLSESGLFFPGGHCPSVGVGGFLLGGGFGMNAARLGLAAYMVEALDVVMADGQLLHVTDESHPEIMWAARGSGMGFFAAVTRFYVRLQPTTPKFAMSTQTHPIGHMDKLIEWFHTNWEAIYRNGATAIIVAMRVPTPAGDQTVLNLVSYAGADTFEIANALLAPLTKAPGLDAVLDYLPPTEVTIRGIFDLFEKMYPKGPRYLSDNVYLPNNGGPAQWAAVKESILSLPAAGCSAWLLPNNSPTAHQNAAYKVFENCSFQAYASYTDPALDESMLAWHTAAMARVDPFSLGAGYNGDSNLFINPVAVLPHEPAQRLEVLRAKYDPEGRFDSFPRALPKVRSI